MQQNATDSGFGAWTGPDPQETFDQHRRVIRRKRYKRDDAALNSSFSPHPLPTAIFRKC
jgi:hypothetical protein